jgi:hypothetical protein
MPAAERNAPIMLKSAFATILALSVCIALGAQQSGQPAMPPNHPQIKPQLPQGHPPINPTVPELQPPPDPNPDDVKSVDAIIKAYYASVSGPKGQERDWKRLRSLMLPEVHFLTTRPLDNAAMPMILSLDQFVEVNKTYFEKGGYFEDEISRKVDNFGNVAQAFSTYESRHARSDAQPYSRGINSIQLLNDGRRWYIASVMWDFERQGTNPIPPQYLPTSAGDKP